MSKKATRGTSKAQSAEDRSAEKQSTGNQGTGNKSAGNKSVSTGRAKPSARRLRPLERELADYQQLFRATEVPTIILDQAGVCLDYNDAFAHIIGNPDRSSFKHFNPADYAPPLQPDGTPSAVKAAQSQRQVFEHGGHRFEWMIRLPDGKLQLSEVCVELIQLGERHCAHIQIKDISIHRRLERLVNQRTSELESKKQELENLSMLDALTQVYNRRKFAEFAKLESARAYRRGSPLGILILDIDFFKQYNDNYGHLAGDKCIVKVARILKQTISRDTDVFARWGGEEFIVLVSETDLKDMREIAGRLLQAVRTQKIRHDHSAIGPHLTVSIGGALGIPKAKDPECQALIKIADKLLYQVKAGGRDDCLVESI